MVIHWGRSTQSAFRPLVRAVEPLCLWPCSSSTATAGSTSTSWATYCVGVATMSAGVRVGALLLVVPASPAPNAEWMASSISSSLRVASPRWSPLPGRPSSHGRREQRKGSPGAWDEGGGIAARASREPALSTYRLSAVRALPPASAEDPARGTTRARLRALECAQALAPTARDPAAGSPRHRILGRVVRWLEAATFSGSAARPASGRPSPHLALGEGLAAARFGGSIRDTGSCPSGFPLMSWPWMTLSGAAAFVSAVAILAYGSHDAKSRLPNCPLADLEASESDYLKLSVVGCRARPASLKRERSRSLTGPSAFWNAA